VTTYMGTDLGSMVPVKCLSGLRVQPEHRASFTDGLSGRHVWVDHPDRPALRTWSATINVADPHDIGTLVELASLRVPLRMLTDDAVVGNILPPGAVSGAAGWDVGGSGGVAGAVELADGWAATSVLPSSEATTCTSPAVPVVPGRPVAGALYVRAVRDTPATVRLEWLNLDGSIQAVADTNTTATFAAPLPRVIVGATPPSNVFAARLATVNAAQFARPSITWTSQPQPWRPGMGAERVYLAPLSYDVIAAHTGQSLAGYTYTVTELS